MSRAQGLGVIGDKGMVWSRGLDGPGLVGSRGEMVWSGGESRNGVVEVVCRCGVVELRDQEGGGGHRGWGMGGRSHRGGRLRGSRVRSSSGGSQG